MNWRKVAGIGIIAATFIAFYFAAGWVQDYAMVQNHFSRLTGTILAAVAFFPILCLAWVAIRALGFGRGRK